MSEETSGSGGRLLLIATMVGLVILVSLGTWQLYRLQWKLDLIEKRQDALTANPVTLNDIDAGIEHGFDVDWLKVTATGHFRHDLERHVYQLRDGKIGWRVITPFIVPGQFVTLTDTGFVPDDKKQRASRGSSADKSPERTITGYVRTNPEAAGTFTPANDVAANRWYSIDIMALADTMPEDIGYVAPDRFAVILPVLLQLAPEAADPDATLPIVDPVDVKMRNNHLQYAVTWYGLAVVLVVISVLFHRSRNQRKPE